MPELPEVETVKNSLKDLIIGKKITNVKVYYDKILQNISKEEFEKILVGETFRDIQRKGKFLIFILDNYILVSHLRMEGKYFLKTNESISKHDHIIYTFTNGENLRYNDTRKFGVLYLFKDTNVDNIMKVDPLSKLGIEPISGLLTVNYLKSKMGKSNKPIKTLLLDQTIISGLGNIYADEVCFMCKLNPHEPGKNLDDKNFQDIVTYSKIVLEKAIKLGGTTIKSFMSSHEVTGRFQNELLVHTKETCPICKSNIRKVYIGGRGTYYCLNCQKPKHLLIGITGGIACGKSILSEYLISKDYKVFDCDNYTHYLLSMDEVITKLVKTFGDEILENNIISRKKLGSIVFSDDEKRHKLEQIIHPYVINKIKSLTGLVFVEVPLLFEANLKSLFYKVICVSTTPELQTSRLMERNNLSIEEATKRISLQMSLKEKENKSDYIINNTTDIQCMYKQIDSILETI